jgi:hypothetical protein
MTNRNTRQAPPRPDLAPFLELIASWHAFLRGSRPGDVSPDGWKRSTVLSVLQSWSERPDMPAEIRAAARGRFHVR